jgi:hypothetical protein
MPCLRACSVLVAVLVLLGAAPLMAADILVPGNQPTIQAGIDAAETGDAVILTAATYTGPGNWDVDFLGKAITVRSQGGDPLGCVVNCLGRHENPRRGFLFQNGETHSTVLQGVTIRRGYDGTQAHIDGFGAGILCSSSPRIVDCRIDSCEAAGYYSASGYGGAVGLGTGSPTFEGCAFVANRAHYGGAVSGGGTPTFTDCTFVDNYATWGGAFHLGVGDAAFTDCTFLDNQGHGGGGALYIVGSGQHLFTRCRFEDNRTGYNAGGPGGAVYSESDAANVFDQCDFVHNQGSYSGGAVESKDASFLACLFYNNWVDDGPGGNGGMGGVFNGWGEVSFVQCTLAHNGGRISGAIYVLGTANLALERTIISGSQTGEAVYVNDGAVATVSCCNIHGNAGGDWTGDLAGLLSADGNLSENPQYCGVPGSWFYKLQSDSPCAPAHNDCGMLIGARPVGCGTTPAFLASFDLRPVMNTVVATWSTAAPGVAAEFRLSARTQGATWEVPVTQPTPEQYEAVDDDPQRGGAGIVSYALLLRQGGGWSVLHEVQLSLPAPGTRVRLENVHPNPCNPRTSVAFTLGRAQRVRLAVHDLAGRLVAVLIDGPLGEGSHRVDWDGRDASGARAASGSYLVRLVGEDGRDSHRLLLLK